MWQKLYIMQNENIALQAKIFLYHLNNSNSENGLRPSEGWHFSMVSEEGKSTLERDFYPTVVTKVDPEIIHDFSKEVLLNLNSNKSAISLLDATIDIQAGSEFFIAHSPSRERR